MSAHDQGHVLQSRMSTHSQVRGCNHQGSNPQSSNLGTAIKLLATIRSYLANIIIRLTVRSFHFLQLLESYEVQTENGFALLLETNN